VPDAEQEVGVIFPVQGIETSCEFSRQPADTAPVGINVRTFESITLRARGGSRSGLTQYVPAQPAGANPIQHLNVLVDPQDPNLDITGGTVPDPSTNNLSVRNPGRFVPVGGSGQQLNRNVVSNAPKPGRLIQASAFFMDLTYPSQILSYTSQPGLGNLLFMVAFGASVTGALPSQGSPPGFSGIKSGGGHLWTQVGGGGYVANTGFVDTGSAFLDVIEVSMWYYYATAGSTDQQVNIVAPVFGSMDDSQLCQVTLLEYAGLAGGPTNQAKQSVTSNLSPWTSGALLLSNVPNELVIAAMMGQVEPIGGSGFVTSVTPGGGFTSRTVVNGSNGVNNWPIVMDKNGIHATTITPSVTPSAASQFIAMATAFNPM
jgi:hypothetical protein